MKLGANDPLSGAAQPLVSVILPVRNRAHCVGRAIASVLAQSYAPIELIVVDDGSSDATADVAGAFGGQVRLVKQAPAGTYAARNAGLAVARGQLIAFIDSDDAWLPDKLTRQMALMRPGIGLVFGDAIHVSAPRRDAPRLGVTSFEIAPPRRGHCAPALANCNFLPTCTVLVRRSALDAVGGFSEAQPVSADYLAWVRIALRTGLDFVDEPVAEYTVHAGGISFDLGCNLAARIGLFQAELAATADPRARALLRRILFNTSLSLALATLRGRARNVRRPLQIAWRGGLRPARLSAASWATRFLANQLWVRTRRLRT
jgi:hypothetical protein